MALVTVDEIRQYLNISSNVKQSSDANLTNYANLASTAIESYCGREFIAANVTEIHDGGKPSIFVNRPPINSINVVYQYDGYQYIPLSGPSNATGERPNLKVNASSTLDYVIYPDIGQISVLTNEESGDPAISVFPLKTFNNYSRGVKIDYNGGYTTIPSDLVMATMDLVKLLYKGEQGSVSVSLQGETKSQFLLAPNSFPPHIKRILDFYRII